MFGEAKATAIEEADRRILFERKGAGLTHQIMSHVTKEMGRGRREVDYVTRARALVWS